MLLAERNEPLQSMRGIAALTVLFAHCLVMFPNGRIETPSYVLSADNALLTALQVTVHGNSAVMFFYVLSGLVLGESYRRSDGRWLPFAIRRAFRLYPAMILSVVLGATMLVAVSGSVVPGMYPPMAVPMHTPVTFSAIIRNIIGLEYDLNPLLWSVQVEIVMVAVLPILIAVNRRIALAGDVMILAVLVGLNLTLWGTTPNPLRFVYCFQVGLMLPRLLSFAPFWSGIVAIGGIALMALVEWLYVRGTLWLPYKFTIDTLISAQWVGFVLLRRDLPFTKFLTARPLVYLGDISYGIYVYSMVVQFALVGLVFPRLLSAPPTNNEATILEISLALGTAAISIPLAAITYAAVERPCIALGRRASMSTNRIRNSELARSAVR